MLIAHLSDRELLPKIKQSNVTVTTGKVQVANKTKLLSVLTPTRKLIFDKQSLALVTNNNVRPQFNDWTIGKIYLHQAILEKFALVQRNNFAIQIKAGTKTVSKNPFILPLVLQNLLKTFLKLLLVRFTIQLTGRRAR